jgi:hypothetical protein
MLINLLLFYYLFMIIVFMLNIIHLFDKGYYENKGYGIYVNDQVYFIEIFDSYSYNYSLINIFIYVMSTVIVLNIL